MNHTKDDLRELQSKSLEEKIQISTARIIEWYESWNGQVCVSFSGGKDSTVLLDLVRRTYPDVLGVFSDTGLEFPKIRAFVKTFSNIEIVKPKMVFGEVITKFGYPIISKQCSRMIWDLQHPTFRN
nr:MAG TPA: phosphoadenosine-phosphosulfate reductase [Caudoviricetes sp.]